jgi:hypothetical protein
MGGLNVNVEALGGSGGLPQNINIILLQGLKLASTVLTIHTGRVCKRGKEWP